MQSYWDRLSDDELLQIRFTTDDPESLEGLVQDVPVTDTKPIVELAYDFRGSKRSYIRCAHCKYPNHLAGFVIRTADGARFLCGHNCGDKIYGADFGQLHRDFTRARDRAGYLHIMRKFRLALPLFVSWLDQLQLHPAFELYDQTRAELRSKMPRLYGALSTLRDGALSITEKVRDFEAETRDEDRYEHELEEWRQETVTERKKMKRDGYEPRKPKKPIYKSVPRRIGTVSAPTLFNADANPLSYVRDAVTKFNKIAETKEDELTGEQIKKIFAYKGRKDNSALLPLARMSVVGLITTADMAALLAQVRALLDQIEQQVTRLEELNIFFQPTTLLPVARWANAERLAGTYEAGVKALRFTNEDSEQQTVHLPRDYTIPSLQGLQTFRSALS